MSKRWASLHALWLMSIVFGSNYRNSWFLRHNFLTKQYDHPISKKPGISGGLYSVSVSGENL